MEEKKKMSEKIRVMFSEEQVNEKIKELGAQISADMKGEPVKIICILKGASFFAVSYTHLDVYKRQVHIAVIKMQWLLPWHYVRLQHTIRPRARLCGMRCWISMRNTAITKMM